MKVLVLLTVQQSLTTSKWFIWHSSMYFFHAAFCDLDLVKYMLKFTLIHNKAKFRVLCQDFIGQLTF